jgi:AraC-like DNA-binding protein
MSYKREKILPYNRIELIFNLDPAPHKVLDNADSGKYTLYKTAWLCGMRTKYLVIEPTGRSHMIGIRFKPGGAWPFFESPLERYRDNVIELDDVSPGLAALVQQQLTSAGSVDDKYAVLQALLHSLSRGPLIQDPTVARAVAYLENEDSPSIANLAKQLHMSGKSLVALFRSRIGISPKALARVYKFQRVLTMLEEGVYPTLAEVAHDAGYYDQAHFCKEFQSFCGINPTRYFAMKTERYFLTVE